MYSTDNRSRMIGFAISTAMAGVLLAGCATSAPQASVSASKAEAALASGKHDKAVSHAEAAVLADPRNPQYRSTLGAAYLDAGRFASATQAFDDAMTLGDEGSRTKLSLALSLVAEGKNPEALALIDDARSQIAPSDLGLAYALAGKPGYGVDILTTALRGGENTAKVRQNLAYAYALNGQWREARIMAAQDVPADQLGGRMEEWAATVYPDAYRSRVASLLGVPATVSDPGQPIALALGNFPTNEQLAYEAQAVEAVASAQSVEAAPAPELPALASASTAPVAVSVPASSRAEPIALPPIGDAPAAYAPARQDEARVARSFDSAFTRTSETEAQTAKSTFAKQSAAPSSMNAAAIGSGSHLVQLGSFSSEANARKAWDIYLKRYPELAGKERVITEAVVKGKRYWRVSAGGFASNNAQSLCGKVRNSGKGCFAYAEGKPLPGAVATTTRLASR